MFKRIASLLLISLLAACGGSGDGGTSLYAGNGTSTSGTGTSTSGSGTTGVTSGTTGSVVVNISSNVISSSTPGLVTALAKDASGNPIVGTVVTFAVSDTSIATVSPKTGLHFADVANSIGGNVCFSCH